MPIPDEACRGFCIEETKIFPFSLTYSNDGNMLQKIFRWGDYHICVQIILMYFGLNSPAGLGMIYRMEMIRTLPHQVLPLSASKVEGKNYFAQSIQDFHQFSKGDTLNIT
jgi:hypothetical protein